MTTLEPIIRRKPPPNGSAGRPILSISPNNGISDCDLFRRDLVYSAVHWILPISLAVLSSTQAQSRAVGQAPYRLGITFSNSAMQLGKTFCLQVMQVHKRSSFQELSVNDCVFSLNNQSFKTVGDLTLILNNLNEERVKLGFWRASDNKTYFYTGNARAEYHFDDGLSTNQIKCKMAQDIIAIDRDLDLKYRKMVKSGQLSVDDYKKWRVATNTGDTELLKNCA